MEARSQAEDCNELYWFLKDKLGNKLDYYGTTKTGLFNGIYYFKYLVHDNYGDLTYDSLPFYMKFCKGAFLCISVGKNFTLDSTTNGEKLAALSDFYMTIVDTYGKPTVFYTTKDDDDELFTLQWSFIEKEEEIAKFKNDTYFDDASIDKLIIFDEEKDETLSYKFKEQTKIIIEKQIGLPFELLPLVDENIDDYISYKKGKELEVPEDAKSDCLPVTSYKVKVKKLIK